MEELLVQIERQLRHADAHTIQQVIMDPSHPFWRQLWQAARIFFPWRENAALSAYRFDLISDGTTGREWVHEIESRGLRLTQEVRSFLMSESFRPTHGITYPCVVLVRDDFNKEIPKSLNLKKPHPEIACLLTRQYPELEQHRLWRIFVMHELFPNSGLRELRIGICRGYGGLEGYRHDLPGKTPDMGYLYVE